jgi:hypothetical protein
MSNEPPRPKVPLALELKNFISISSENCVWSKDGITTGLNFFNENGHIINLGHWNDAEDHYLLSLIIMQDKSTLLMFADNRELTMEVQAYEDFRDASAYAGLLTQKFNIIGPGEENAPSSR